MLANRGLVCVLMFGGSPKSIISRTCLQRPLQALKTDRQHRLILQQGMNALQIGFRPQTLQIPLQPQGDEPIQPRAIRIVPQTRRQTLDRRLQRPVIARRLDPEHPAQRTTYTLPPRILRHPRRRGRPTPMPIRQGRSMGSDRALRLP